MKNVLKFLDISSKGFITDTCKHADHSIYNLNWPCGTIYGTNTFHMKNQTYVLL